MLFHSYFRIFRPFVAQCKINITIKCHLYFFYCAGNSYCNVVDKSSLPNYIKKIFRLSIIIYRYNEYSALHKNLIYHEKKATINKKYIVDVQVKYVSLLMITIKVQLSSSEGILQNRIKQLYLSQFHEIYFKKYYFSYICRTFQKHSKQVNRHFG